MLFHLPGSVETIKAKSYSNNRLWKQVCGMIVYVGDKIYHLVFLDKTLSILVSLINYCMTPYLKS